MAMLMSGGAGGCFPDPPQCVGDNPCDDDGDSEVDETETDDAETGDVEDGTGDGSDSAAIDGEASEGVEVGDVAGDTTGEVETDTEVASEVVPDTQTETETQAPPDTEVPPDTDPPDTQPEVETIAETIAETVAETIAETTAEVDAGPDIVVIDCEDLLCAVEHRECIEGAGAVDAVCGGCLSGYSAVGGECLAATQPPTGVTATSDRASDVEVEWSALADATGYHVYRCDLASCPGDTGWFVLTSAAITTTSYLDETVSLPALPSAPGSVAATRNGPTQVALTWNAVTVAAAPSYRYRVVAIGAAGASPGSLAAQGKVADRPVTGYELNIDGGGWTNVGLVTQYSDLLAAAPTVTALTATASQNTFEEWVRLSASGGAVTQGAERQYEVRATTTSGPGPSGMASGWRVGGALTLQWERSAGASADGFSAISGATTTAYDDMAAPADGSTRWYRIVASATGAVSQPSAAVSGSRLNPTSLVPTGVTASIDRLADVEIRWSPVANATGYYVSRCDVTTCTSGSWSALNGVALTSASYLDGTVAVPALPGAPGSVVASGEPTEVTLTWAAITVAAAKRYSYRVTAVVSGSQGAPSTTAVGQVAERPLTGYEVRVDSGAWTALASNVYAYQDSAAPAPTLSAVTATASQGTYAEYVRLTSSGAAATPGALRNYDVRAVTAQGAGPESSASGRRTAGSLTYQWERSSGTTAAGFAALSGATAASYDDTGAPTDGSVRFYRLVVSATGATPVTSTAVSGMKLGPPTTAPTAVLASNDLDDMVKVTWQALAGATSYHVYRDGVKLTSGSGITTTSYEDRAITAAGSWAAPTSLTASTNNTNQVDLAWVAATRPLGPTASYTVRAVNAAGEGPASGADSGQRAAPPLLGYEVEVAPVGLASAWLPTGSTVVAYTHLDPPKGTISGGTLTTTQGTKRASVDLTTSGGTVTAAVQVDYRVRGILPANAFTTSSTSVRGNRAVGTLSRQWRRSSSTSNGSFANLSGFTGTSHLDTTAPSDGAHRWYEVVLGASGCNPVTVAAVEGWRLAFVAVDGGGEHACGLTANNRIWCWGNNSTGRLGISSTTPTTAVVEVLVPSGVSGYTSVSTYSFHTCATSTSGEVWCWGDNSHGELGDGTVINKSLPVKVVGLTGTAIAVAASTDHTCALTSSTTVQCWGNNNKGQLGNNSTNASSAPVTVRTAAASLTSVIGISAGSRFACARRASDTYCWGSNSSGELGNSGTTDSSVAVQVSGLGSTAEVTQGASHSCARLPTGAVHCWGANSYGQLGDNSISDRSSPVAVFDISNAVKLAALGAATCVEKATGVTSCFGRNNLGQLGNGTLTDSSVPVAIVGLSASSIGAGVSFGCAVVDNAIKCWGLNANGQLGDGTVTNRSAPVNVILP